MTTLSIKKTQAEYEKDSPELFFYSLEVIKHNRLLTVGFRAELTSLFMSIKSPTFKKKHLLRVLGKYCTTPEYKALDPYGYRYNIDNFLTHKVVDLRGVENALL